MANIVATKKDLIWSYVGNFLKLAINVLLLPIILHYLSDDELGMWYVFASIGQLIILLDFGFAPSLARNIAYVWCGARVLSMDKVAPESEGKTDPEYFSVVVSTCKYLYVAISIVAFLLLLFVGTPYIASISNDKVFIYSWVVFSIGAFLNVLYSYYSSLLIGIGLIAENNKAGAFSKICQIIICVILLLFGYGLLGVCIAYLASGVTYRLLSRFYFYNTNDVRILLEYKVTNRFSKIIKVFKTISHNAFKDGLVTLSNYLSTQANTLICSSVLGLSTTGAYGLAVQLSSIVSSISSIPFATIQPSLQENALHGDTVKSKTSFSRVMVAFLLSFILLSITIIVCLPLLRFFKPTLDVNLFMLATLLLSVFIYQAFHLSASYISTFNTLPYTKSFVVSSIASVLLSYILARITNMGLWALVLSPLIVSLTYNAWKWPKYVLNMTNLSLREFLHIGYNSLKETLLKTEIVNRVLNKREQ